MHLLEREAPLQALERSFSSAASGHGRIVLLHGEAGIGKSALIQGFASAHAGNARVLEGACDALVTPRPLGPLLDIARKCGGHLRELIHSGGSRESLFEAFLELLGAGPDPALVVVEDAHWADDATLDLFTYVGRRISNLPALVVVTYRSDEIGPAHPLRRFLGTLPSAATTHAPLRPLSREAVVELARATGQPAEQIHEITGGNPFFVTEVLAGGEATVPATVRDAVLGRMTGLSRSGRALADVVSISPRRVPLPACAAILGDTAGAIEECLSRGVLQSDGDALFFRHELARLAVEESLSPTRRKQLHRSMLDHLATARISDPAALAAIVHHARGAGAVEALLEFGPRAAAAAAAVGAHREAAAHYAAAVEAGPAIDPPERADLLERLAYECYLVTDIDRAIASREAALAIRRAEGQALLEGDNLRWLSRLSWFHGENRRARGYAEQAIATLEPLGPSVPLARAYSNLSQLHMLEGSAAESLLWGQRAIELAGALGDDETVAHALNNVGTAEWNAGDERGAVKLEESLRISVDRGFEEHAARAWTNLGSLSCVSRRYGRALRYLTEGIGYCRELDNWTLYMSGWLAWAQLEAGLWDAAAVTAHVVLDGEGSVAVDRVMALIALGLLRTRRGDPGADEALDEAHALAVKTGELQRLAPAAAARAEAAWVRGDLAACVREAEAPLALAREKANPWEIELLEYWRWRGGADPGEFRSATPLGLEMEGQPLQAAAAWRRCGGVYPAARAQLSGRGSDRDALVDALRVFEELGALPMAERTRGELRKAGFASDARKPRKSTRSNIAGLTGRELEVLALLSEGLADSEIGARLFISPKTASHHVASILAKLSARNRAEAVRRAGDLGFSAQASPSMGSDRSEK